MVRVLPIFGNVLLALDILRDGYLPRELPPSFSSHAFAQASPTLPRGPKEWTTPTGLNLARPGSLRRRLDIVNPFSAKLMAEQVAAGWTELAAHYGQSEIGMSSPVSGAPGSRAIVWRSGWAERRQQRASRMYRARYVLRSDVSEFYPSVYTHSLEWALHGKSASKARLRSRTPDPLGALLDTAVRHGQDGQTKGLPVGPDASLAAAEVIMTAVDLELQKQYPGIATFSWRAVDDLEVFSSTQSEAEDILVTWQSSLASYELVANPRKTLIVPGPQPLEPGWRIELAQMRIRSAGDSSCASDLYSFFSRAFELVARYPTEAVLSYAIAKCRSYTGVGPQSAQALQELVLASVVVEPSCLTYAAMVLELLHKRGFKIGRDRLASTLNDLCEYHSRREHGSEVAWALYMIRRFELKLEEASAVGIAAMVDNCSLVMLFDLVDAGQVPSGPDLSLAIARAEAPEAWRSEDWLLALECSRRGWANDAELKATDGWKTLLARDIGFFHTAPTLAVAALRPSSPARAAASGADAQSTASAGISDARATPDDAEGSISSADALRRGRPPIQKTRTPGADLDGSSMASDTASDADALELEEDEWMPNPTVSSYGRPS
jgi:hypothetical protein